MHLREKPAAFRVIDTHAGAGRYDLAGAEASARRRMARRHRPAAGRAARAAGRARCSRPISMRSRPAIRPDGSTAYPGSPRSCAPCCGAQDRLIACELEPSAAAALARNLARRPARQGDRDRRLDRAQRLRAAEGTARPGADRSAVRAGRTNSRASRKALAAAHRKWATGIYLLWYPIKDARRARCAWRAALRRSAASAKILRAELSVGAARAPGRLRGCGLIVVNPPWTLAGELASVAAGACRPCSRGGKRRRRTASTGSPAKR